MKRRVCRLGDPPAASPPSPATRLVGAGVLSEWGKVRCRGEARAGDLLAGQPLLCIAMSWQPRESVIPAKAGIQGFFHPAIGGVLEQ